MAREQPVTAEDRTELRALAESWLSARPAGLSPDRLLAPVPIPGTLADTLTRSPDWRPRAEEDARSFLAAPRILQLGLEVHLEEPLACRPFEHWERCIAPLRVRTTGRDRMDAWQALPTGQGFTWPRVAHEGGHWRIVQLLDEKTRRELARQRELLVRHARGDHKGSSSKPQ